MCIYDPSTGEAEVEQAPVQGQPGLQSDTLSPTGSGEAPLIRAKNAGN